MTDFKPIPDPAGSLEPPRRRPPTAVGTATPEPESEHEPAMHRRGRTRSSALRHALLVLAGIPLVGVRNAMRAARELVTR